MKNQIYIDVDTEREQPILIGKGEAVTPPTTPEGAMEMITTDITCLCEAMCTLIHMATINGYGTKDEYITELKARLDRFSAEVQAPVEEPAQTNAPQEDGPDEEGSNPTPTSQE